MNGQFIIWIKQTTGTEDIFLKGRGCFIFQTRIRVSGQKRGISERIIIVPEVTPPYENVQCAYDHSYHNDTLISNQ